MRRPRDEPTAYSAINGVAIGGLLCPSDGQAPPLWATPDDHGGLRLAKSNYLGMFSGTSIAEGWVRINVGTGQCERRAVHPLPPRPFDRRAVFGYGTGTRTQMIKDGASTTIAVAEYLRGVSDRDGHVAFIADTIDSQVTAPYGTWQRLAWIDDGLPVEAAIGGSYPQVTDAHASPACRVGTVSLDTYNGGSSAPRSRPISPVLLKTFGFMEGPVKITEGGPLGTIRMSQTPSHREEFPPRA